MYAPLPVKNYGLGALDIPASHIVTAAIITGAPFCWWWAYLGSKAKNLVDIIDGRGQVQLLAMPSNPIAVALIFVAGGLAFALLVKKGWAAWQVAKDELAAEKSGGKKKSLKSP